MEKIKLNIKPDPDFRRITLLFKDKNYIDRVPFYELFADLEIEHEVLMRLDKLEEDEKDFKKGKLFYRSLKDIKKHIKYQYYLGYDYINVSSSNFYKFPRIEWTESQRKEGSRAYVQSSDSIIRNYDDFENYPWPDMKRVDYSNFEKVQNFIPEGMKIIGNFSGMLENVMWLLGFEGISFFLYDKPELVKDTFNQVATRIINYFENLASMDVIGALAMGEDMGFKTGTMLSPDIYRELVFPWHKKLVETVHLYGKPIILHSCGNLFEIMEDIISCGWDGKHSFEDNIKPIWEVKKEYGDRITLLGGFDMDKLCRMNKDEVISHTKFLIKKCSKNGGWALGTGNSVASYINIDNFFTMLEQGYNYNLNI